MSYAIVGILVVAFIAMVVLSAKSWHWADVLFLVLVFLTGLAGLVAMSQVLDMRRKQMLEVKRVGEELIRLQDEIELVLNGPSPSFEFGPDSLRGLSEALNLEIAGRGRVWRSGTVEEKGDNRVFKFSGDRVQSPENPASMIGMLVFVYADQALNDELYPVSFVGTMRVLSETSNSLEMEPVSISDRTEHQSPSSTWTLYEKPPADFHEAYIRDTGIVLDEDDPQLNDKITQFREILETQFMPAELFGFDLEDINQAKEHESIIDRVVFDGLPLFKIESWVETQPNRISPRFDPPNEEIFVRYRFNEKSNRSYQVDSQGNISSDGRFTPGGQAVDPALHAGIEIEFQKGDEILVDQLTADGYQRDDEPVSPFPASEPVTEVSRIYVRQLRDYPYLLATLQRQVLEYEAEIARIAFNNQQSQLAIQDTEEQINVRAEINEKLLEDQARLQADMANVNRYTEEIRFQKIETEGRLRALESEIREQHRRIKGIARALQTVPLRDPGEETAPFVAPPPEFSFPTGSPFPAGEVILPDGELRQ